MPLSKTMPGLTRRQLMITAGAAAGLTTLPHRLLAGDPVKVAGVYTVPVEQQWVSRIHQAAEAAKTAGLVDYTYSENTANTDYPRVLREYAEQGYKLIVGEIFGAEQEAREVVGDYPDVAFLLGSSFPPDEAYPNLSVFDNFIQDASYLSGIIAGAMTVSRRIVGRYLHLLYSALTILAFPLTVWLQMDHNAAMQAYMSRHPEMAKMPGMSFSTGPTALIVGIAIAAVIGLSYPLFLLIWFGLVKKTQQSMTGNVERPMPAA